MVFFILGGFFFSYLLFLDFIFFYLLFLDSSFFFQFCECAWAAGRGDLAAGVVRDTAERIYAHWDKHEAVEGLPLPGVSAENWVPAGMEGYGWGATLPLAIIRCLMGVRARWRSQLALELRPGLPGDMMSPGNTYGVGPLSFRNVQFSLSYHVQSGDRIRAVLQREDDGEDRWAVESGDGTPLTEGLWTAGKRLLLPVTPGEGIVLYRR